MNRTLFVRHAETDRAGTFCGHLDPGLNAAGSLQARKVAQCVAAMGVVAVYASDLLRARETAERIAMEAQAPLTVSSALREIGFGRWEGLPWETIEERYPEEASLWLAHFPAHAAPGGEEFLSFRKRVLDEIHRIRASSLGTVCIVSHGGAIRLALTEIFGMPDAEAWASTRNYGSLIDPSRNDSHQIGEQQ